MDVGGPQVSVRTSTSFLLLMLLLQTSTRAQQICNAPLSVSILENNAVDEVVAVITVEADVTVDFKTPSTDPDYPFTLKGNQLTAARVLDYEAETTYEVELTCKQKTPVITLDQIIIVLVININDNAPRFVNDPCRLEVRELSAVDTLIGSCLATDADPNTRLFYSLSSETEGVKLQSPTSPNILVQRRLDYDKVKTLRLMLYVQDTPLLAEVEPSNNASSTLLVSITDVDNRPPWFQPCTKYTVGEDVICQNMGYTGRVTFNELQVGALPLEPGPLYAIDGDAAINEEITYTILSGNDADMFQINSDSGNISMRQAAGSLTAIVLTVVASQRRNGFQLATSTVTFSVLEKSLHPPRFEKPQYNGTVNAVGTMVMVLNNKDEALQILAKDLDYTGGLNPDITYRIIGSSDFVLIDDGFLFMIKDLPATTINLQVEALDTTNDDSATCEVTVEVTTGLSTTSEAPSTTTPTATTNASTSMTTDITNYTSKPNTTPEDVTSTASTADALTDGVLRPPGAFGSEDMVALGATLGVLLFVCLLVIGLLVCRVQRGKADWRKVDEASVFRSSLGQGSSGRKEGIQFTNEAFQKDEDDAGTSGSGGPEERTRTASETQTRNVPINTAIVQSAEPSHGDGSQAGTEKTDHEKEVKPILTKERRMEDGYKAVWFKEDIDPDAKEEVVIIPDSRDEEEEEERSTSSREEDEDDGSQIKIPKVGFSDTDLDSGLGVKMDDPAEDSEEDNVLTADL